MTVQEARDEAEMFLCHPGIQYPPEMRKELLDIARQYPKDRVFRRFRRVVRDAVA